MTLHERDQASKAKILRNTVGWSRAFNPATRINSRGGIDLALEVEDGQIADKIRSGSLKFTSPETRSLWLSPAGEQFSDVITHIAITNHPSQRDQEADFRPADPQTLQFSDSPFKELRQMPNDPEEKTEDVVADQVDNEVEASEVTEVSEDNPDSPNAGGDPQLSAVIEHLSAIGLALPADTTMENLVTHLLTSLKTMEAVKAIDKDENTGHEEEVVQEATEIQQEPVGQFSEIMADPAKMEAHIAKLVADQVEIVKTGKTQQYSEGACQRRLIKRISDASGKYILPGLAKRLLAKVNVSQFSEFGDEISAGSGTTISDVLDDHEASGGQVDSFLQSQAITGDATVNKGDEVAEHPRGAGYLDGEEYGEGSQQTEDEVKRIVANAAK